MEEKSAKISFGFSKITKKPLISNPKPEIIKKVDRIQFIDSVENQSFKIINEDKTPEKVELVIPMKNPNDLLDNMKEAVKSRLKTEDEVSTNVVSDNNADPGVKKESLEEMAAREIIEDLNKVKEEKESVNNFTVPISEKAEGEKESTLEDYDNIPIKDFGLAMLRGMGWQPTKGIGKNEQVVKTEMPQLRPKGMGLGADKVIKPQKPTGMNVQTDSVLKKTSKVRITVGKHKNLYGTVQGFDDDSGRVSVKLSIGSEVIWINECYVQLVTVSEFDKYSQVINLKTYSDYKDENSGSRNETKHIPESSVDIKSSKKVERVDSVNSESDVDEYRRGTNKSSKNRVDSTKSMKERSSRKSRKTYSKSSSEDSVSDSSSEDNYHKRSSKSKNDKVEKRRNESSSYRKQINEKSGNGHKKRYDSSSDSETDSRRSKKKSDDKRKLPSDTNRHHKSHRHDRSRSPKDHARKSKKKHKNRDRSSSYEDKRRNYR